MAIAGIPVNLAAQQGNAQVLLTWNPVAGATGYSVTRSTDNINFSVLAAPTLNQYLDTTADLYTQYYYSVASVNASGMSSYCASQGAIPTEPGVMTLSQLRLYSRQRADRVNSNFVTDSELNTYLNQSADELYDVLVTQYEDYYLAPPIQIQTDGSAFFDLPNGVNYNKAAPFYKLMGVDLGINGVNGAYLTIRRFNFLERNKYVYPNLTSNFLGVVNMQYRVLGNRIEFIPSPQAGQQVRLWYIPRLTTMLADTDTIDGVSGWTEYVIVDAAIKILQKEESDTSVLMAQKMALLKRINDSASNRDAGEPETVSNINQSGMIQMLGIGGYGV